MKTHWNGMPYDPERICIVRDCGHVGAYVMDDKEAICAQHCHEIGLRSLGYSYDEAKATAAEIVASEPGFSLRDLN